MIVGQVLLQLHIPALAPLSLSRKEIGGKREIIQSEIEKIHMIEDGS